MDAAQMLTAHEIARQCRQRARTVERHDSDAASGGVGGHLRVVEPVTQPVERVPTQERRSTSAPTGRGARGGELTEREREILAFERQWWKHPDSKERAVRELFGLALAEYHRLLEDLLDEPAAMRSEPMLVKRLRRQRRTGGLDQATTYPYGSTE
ncbi:DUF3263 domain-containing protein [Actinopolyspora mortivallis]|uniref:DUF3263 domain-containing protein n=1 Tax=Actinopolyspora mortivallis TaxID=33906 RepID=UPI00036661AA|nr:DUF3263 domain-containing protein [Actinopolyspora mortivallis]